MPHFNSVTFIGHLAREPEVRYSQAGKAVTNGAMGVNFGWGDNKDSFFIDFVVFGKTGEKLAEWCRKGDAVLIQGEMTEDKWNDNKTGEPRKKMKVVVRDWTKIAGKRGQDDAPGGDDAPRRKRREPEPVMGDDLDKIPF